MAAFCLRLLGIELFLNYVHHCLIIATKEEGNSSTNKIEST
jgi:hypothetical protein